MFGCINPNCWNQKDSWTCLRSQLLDPEVTHSSFEKLDMEWCSGANDWDDDNGNFENGNSLRASSQNPSDNDSEEDSCSLTAIIENLNLKECNANWDGFEKSSGAVGKQMSPVASAEIEQEESEVVTIDTPTMPKKDLLSLLQESAPVPYYMRAGEENQNQCVTFVPFFISVEEENISSNHSDHVGELIQEYQKKHGEIHQHGSNQIREGNELCSEEYEKAVPAHGDKMFYHFSSRIQSNPGQILR